MRTELSQRGDASSSLYFDMAATLNRGYPFTFICGGRGIGKTFSFFKAALDRGRLFMYLRYTGPEFDRACDFATSPISEHVAPFVADSSSGAAAIYDAAYEDDRLVKGELIGYCGALTTFKTARGTSFPFHDGDLCLFDEFIPEPGSRQQIKDPLRSWNNFHETAFRRAKVQTVFCSNSDSLQSPILAGLDLIRPIEYMIDHELTEWADDTRGILIVLPKDVPISAEKRKDPLYKLMQGTDFDAMALKNLWTQDDRHDVKAVKLTEYRPLGSLNDAGILISAWAHKSSGKLYFCRAKAQGPVYNKMQFRAFYQRPYKLAQLADKLLFYDYHVKIKIREVLE